MYKNKLFFFFSLNGPISSFASGFSVSYNQVKQQKYGTVHTHMQKTVTVLSCSQEKEISWMKLIKAPNVTAHVAHIRSSYARSQEVTLILQKYTQSHPDTSKHAQQKHKRKHTRRRIHPSI